MIDLETLKWAATVVLIVASIVNSLGYYPQGPALLIVGGLMWLVASVWMGDVQLIVTNSVMSVAGIGPLCWVLYKRNKNPRG